MNNIILNILLGFCLLFFSCGDRSSEFSDTPTSGKISISADESIQPLISAEVDSFEGIYKYAQIDVSFKSESEAINDLINDKVRLIVIPRELNETEKNLIAEQKIIPRSIKVAYDAIAIIMNLQRNDTLFTLEKLRYILNGTIKNWSELNAKNTKEKITLVLDNKNSSIIRYLKDTFLGNSKLNENSFAVDSSKKVIDYVRKNKNAIGFIGVNWISDTDDSAAVKLLNSVKIAQVAPDTSSKGKGFYYRPVQAYIAQKFYPLYRTVYIITREARAGLGSGFIAFVSSDKGQRIVLKSGLVPATMPIRLIEIDNEEL
jgi:phosphate transport system substrate-binding protein